MSRTCRTLHQVAPRILLAKKVRFYYPARFKSFCLFMLHHDKPDCFYHLRHLALHINRQWYRMGPQLGELLSTVLTRSTELEVLELGDTDFLSLDDRIPRALRALTKLHSLDFRSPTEHFFSMLKEMKAPLTYINAAFFNIVDRPDPMPIFARFKDTLETLAIEWVEFEATGVQFPRLTSLDMAYCDYAELQPIVSCFPNLRNLNIVMDDDDWWDEDVEISRLDNLASQAHNSWTSLQCLSGDLRSLYMLGVRCRVNELQLSSWLDSDVDGQRLSIVLSDVCPAALEVELKVPGFDPLRLAGVLGPTTKTLKKLALAVRFHSKKYEDPSQNIVSRAAFVIEHLLTDSTS